MKSAIFGAAVLASAAVADEKMGFVFELVRHGARAALKSEFCEGFTVAVGQLTPQGMRQRYLLGRHAREKYTQEYDLFSSDFVEGEVYMQSTDVNRTITSGYSELMGIYPPSEAAPIDLTEGEYKSLFTDRGMPQMNIRNSDEINQNLGYSALPNGFVSVPIYTFVEHSILDDVSYSGCPLAEDTVHSRRYIDPTYIDYWWVADFVRDPLADGLGVSREVMDQQNFHNVYDYSDGYVAREFEGVSLADPDTFDQNTYLEMRALQKIELVGMFTKETRRLAFSRMMRKPLEHMQNRANELLGKDFEESNLRYAIYSAHDDQVSNMWEWLSPTNVQMDFVYYASQVVFEFKFDDACLAQDDASEACFSIDVLYNGAPLAFAECAESAKADGTGCSYTDFKKHMANIWYNGFSADDLNVACYPATEFHPTQ